MNEKEKDIRLLLDRFMAGETSLEEEALLGGVVSAASRCER